ncbi:MAG: 4Fe-4S binding protein [Lentisphaerae bacterium]|nr:4Fe-4S binding protein [Lentisphaerota bacterium]
MILTIATVIFVNQFDRATSRTNFYTSDSRTIALPTGSYPKPQQAVFDGKPISYLSVFDENETCIGYIFNSEVFAPEIRGYGGRLNVEVFTNTEGRLLDFAVGKNNETPAYLNQFLAQKDRLIGMYLLDHGIFKGITGVTGATISSEAVRSAVELSANRFFENVIQRANATSMHQSTGIRHDTQGLYLVFVMILAFFITFYADCRGRTGLLFINLFLLGFLFNSLFSTVQIVNLTRFDFPAFGITGHFVLAVLIPITLLLTGNIFCGYICPFGALQEFIGRLLPKSIKPATPSFASKFVIAKYLFLFVIIITFLFKGRPSVPSADPLIRFFSRTLDKPLFAVVGLILIGSLFFSRFWCIYLCPAGGFLNLLGRLSPFRRVFMKISISNCEFKLKPETKDECIMCGLCTCKEPQPKDKPANKKSKGLFITLFVLIALLVVVVTIRDFIHVPHRTTVLSTESEPTFLIRTEDPGVKMIRGLIESRRLSDKEALFYEKLPKAGSGQGGNE